MTHDWIVDVLSDIAKYAKDNNLPALAHCLDDACVTSRDLLRPEAEAQRPPPRRAATGTVLAFRRRAP